MKQKGVTLVELLIVIVVIGIIGTFAIIQVDEIVTNTRIEVDTYNLATLNDLTTKYADQNNISGNIFLGSSNDVERMTVLVEAGLIEKVIIPQQKDAIFQWSIDNQEWSLIGGVLSTLYDTDQTIYQFEETTLEDIIDQGSVSIDMSDWTYNEDGYLENDTGESRLFIPINKVTYTISATAQLDFGTAGGYGIFFDTYLENDDEDRDYGYIFQFDRGYDAMVVRPRSNGREGNVVWRINDEDTSAFPSKSVDAEWWRSIHTIQIVVSNVNASTRSAKFYIDGDYLGEYTYANQIDGKTLYTGFRGWGSSTTKFYGIDIT
jgi:prepilin-type N-terminal cleavage/methylation domain-containing protein